jgi:hypothetical protein
MEVGLVVMSTALESYATLHYSPFVLAPVFESFYQAAANQPKNILLSYLVLPLTLCRDTSRLYGLSGRVQEYRDLTNVCMQLSIDAGGLRIESDLSVTFLAESLDTSVCPVGTIKGARNLGKLLQPLDVPAIYRFLGVEKL